MIKKQSWSNSIDLATIRFRNLCKKLFAQIFSGAVAVNLPCNPNGGSPFMHTAFSRIPSSLFSGWGQSYYARFRLSPVEKTAHSRTPPHRVERPSAKTSTKGMLATAPRLSLQMRTSAKYGVTRSSKFESNLMLDHTLFTAPDDIWRLVFHSNDRFLAVEGSHV